MNYKYVKLCFDKLSTNTDHYKILWKYFKISLSFSSIILHSLVCQIQKRYLDPSQTSRMKRFAKIADGLKRPVLGVCQGSEYAREIYNNISPERKMLGVLIDTILLEWSKTKNKRFMTNIYLILNIRIFANPYKVDILRHNMSNGEL